MNFAEFNKVVRICALICIPLALWTLVTNGSITTFLHPRTLPLIKVSFLILCVMALYNIRKFSTRSSEKSINWKLLALFIPIVLGMYIRPSGLSSRIAIQKGLASVTMTARNPAEQTTAPVDSVSSGNHSATTDSTLPPGLHTTQKTAICDTLRDDSLLLKLDSMYLHPQINAGRKIAMTGFVAPDTILGRHSFFIARMIVSCCAADAMPIGFYCSADSTPGIKDGDWIFLTGIIEPQPVKLPWEEEHRVLPILKVSDIKKTAAPEQQYIYPVAY